MSFKELQGITVLLLGILMARSQHWHCESGRQIYSLNRLGRHLATGKCNAAVAG